MPKRLWCVVDLSGRRRPISGRIVRAKVQRSVLFLIADSVMPP